MADWKAGAGRPIDRIYAWVVTEPDGGEGIASVLLGDQHFPMVGADMERMNSLRPHAAMVRAATGLKVELIEYGSRKVLETL